MPNRQVSGAVHTPTVALSPVRTALVGALDHMGQQAGDTPYLRYTSPMPDAPAPAKPSASVVVVRDGVESIEVLMLRRNEKIAFHGGAWVFPGGRVDESDGDLVVSGELEIAKRAAVRETLEETGLAVSADAMLPFAHWTTPVELPKRFSTWFFAAPASGDDAVCIDNSEIIDHRWLTPTAALALHANGELELPAPTYVTLLGFRALTSVATLTGHLRHGEVQHFVPRLVPITGGRCTVYAEDAAYESRDFETPGARHRLIMRGTDWQYIRQF